MYFLLYYPGRLLKEAAIILPSPSQDGSENDCASRRELAPSTDRRSSRRRQEYLLLTLLRSTLSDSAHRGHRVRWKLASHGTSPMAQNMRRSIEVWRE